MFSAGKRGGWLVLFLLEAGSSISEIDSIAEAILGKETTVPV
jgi:hypothetical protein